MKNLQPNDIEKADFYFSFHQEESSNPPSLAVSGNNLIVISAILLSQDPINLNQTFNFCGDEYTVIRTFQYSPQNYSIRLYRQLEGSINAPFTFN